MRYLIILILLAVVLSAWAPWMEEAKVAQLVNDKITALQNTVPNLCPIEVVDGTLKRAPFGYQESVTYDCSKIDTIYGIKKSENTVFITFFDMVIGMPKKTLEK